MLDTSGEIPTVWEPTLEPLGPWFDKEPFETWWKRHQSVLTPLHPMIAEQWIYRHWTNSPYKHLPLARLVWRAERWNTARILSEVFLRDEFGKLVPESDYKFFRGSDREPGLTMDRSGTWNYPIVIVDTPNGVKTAFKTFPKVRYCLIEGHQRFRYLNALSTRNECAAEHSVFVLSLADLPIRDSTRE